MSTEFSTPNPAASQPKLTSVEVTQTDFRHQSPNLEDSDEEKLMMDEYDENNVIVIDLSEERNASAKNCTNAGQPVPRQMFGSDSIDDVPESIEDNGIIDEERIENCEYHAFPNTSRIQIETDLYINRIRKV